MYTDKRNQLVVFPKSPPLVPPNLLQQSVRNRITAAAYVWRSLSPEQRANWNLAATRARIKIHGYNLFTFYITKADDDTIHTIERLSRLKLIPLFED